MEEKNISKDNLIEKIENIRMKVKKNKFKETTKINEIIEKDLEEINSDSYIDLRTEVVLKMKAKERHDEIIERWISNVISVFLGVIVSVVINILITKLYNTDVETSDIITRITTIWLYVGSITAIVIALLCGGMYYRWQKYYNDKYAYEISLIMLDKKIMAKQLEMQK